MRDLTPPEAEAPPADPVSVTTPGTLGTLRFKGEPYDLDRTTCAACGRSVLMVSRVQRGRKTRSRLYDRITVDAGQGAGSPQGTRHTCGNDTTRPTSATSPPRN